MAAMQHGVAVVATDGHLTDDVLRREKAALALIPVAEPAAFAEEVRRLSADDAERARRGEAGRALYLASFDWPVTIARLRDLLVEASSR
jgi:glycosyltransferase involved in cell wall biosynthesis